MFFMYLTSNPSSTTAQRGFADNVLGNEFTPILHNKGGSARTSKNAAYESTFIKANQFATAKASATRHLASGSKGDSCIGNSLVFGGDEAVVAVFRGPPP